MQTTEAVDIELEVVGAARPVLALGWTVEYSVSAGNLFLLVTSTSGVWRQSSPIPVKPLDARRIADAFAELRAMIARADAAGEHPWKKRSTRGWGALDPKKKYAC